MEENSAKRRQKSKLDRKKSKRDGNDRCLIVCEGKKTEPNYFNEIRIKFRKDTANTRVMTSNLGTSPMNVAKCAIATFQELKNNFERVYVVFDRDDHANFHEALNYLAQFDGKLKNEEKAPVKVIAVPSIPCFELWLLLHFFPVTADMHRNDVYKKLETKLKNYDKGQKGHFENTSPHLATAFKNAEQLRRLKETQDKEFPSTEVDRLVDYLISIK